MNHVFANLLKLAVLVYNSMSSALWYLGYKNHAALHNASVFYELTMEADDGIA